MKKMLILICLMVVVGCDAISIDTAINKYHNLAPQIKLGDSKESVLSILNPTQKELPSTAKKSPDQFWYEDVKVEIYYFRSNRQPDRLTTDDEFTPYVFRDEKLVAVGWAILGGPKTVGRVMPQTTIQTNQPYDSSQQHQETMNQLRQMEHKASFDRMMRGGLP